MNKHQIPSLLLGTLALATLLQSCKTDDDLPDLPNPVINEQEVITSVRLTLTKGGISNTFKWSDPDGPGGNNPTVDTIKLDSSSTYTVLTAVLDESGSTAEDLTPEIIAEADEHIFCYTPNMSLGGQLSITIVDKDANNLSLGTTSSWTVGSASSGSLTVVLKHQTNGIKDGSCSPGETDIEVNFPVVIK